VQSFVRNAGILGDELEIVCGCGPNSFTAQKRQALVNVAKASAKAQTQGGWGWKIRTQSLLKFMNERPSGAPPSIKPSQPPYGE
jgi:hypothetical protein